MDTRFLIRILAVETSTSVLSVDLWQDGVACLETVEVQGRIHSELILPTIDTLLRRSGLSLSDLDAFAVSIGPGSFTGLRVGLSTIKGLAFGLEVPIVPVSTLAALVLDVRCSGPIAVLIDAQREEVYAAWFDSPDTLEGRGESVYTVTELAALLPNGCKVVAGYGAKGAALELSEKYGFDLLPAELGIASASKIAELAAKLLERGQGGAAEELVPRYIRRAEAEVQRTGTRFEN